MQVPTQDAMEVEERVQNTAMKDVIQEQSEAIIQSEISAVDGEVVLEFLAPKVDSSDLASGEDSQFLRDSLDDFNDLLAFFFAWMCV